ncbi:MAG TPA: hypothetical protein VE959_34160 [Bryobacteraceae bacterium]|nr:hypothetical protein [Bryobacteraceae bacterium]
MIPGYLQTLFWDTNLNTFNPAAHPDYTILRVLEFGGEDAVAWMRATFPEAEIRRVLRSERRLSPKSANFWALIYRIPPHEVAALAQSR